MPVLRPEDGKLTPLTRIKLSVSILFGAPGVGNRDYVTKYPDVSVVRVVDNEDQVAKTERKGIIFDLRHPGGVTIKFERPSKLLTEKKHDKLPDLLADHAPIYYAENSWKQVSAD